MTCGECGNVTAPASGFPNHVYCKRFLLHMEKRDDASRCRDFIQKPITNADRIRSMTDEELADLFADNDCGYCRIHDLCFAKGLAIDCEDAWLDWLKQEAKDDNRDH